MNLNIKTKKYKVQRIFLNQRIFWSLIVLVFVSIAAYGLLINQIVWNVVARQKAEATITALNSKVSTLESSFITLSNGITIEKAHELGFKDISGASIKYVNRKDMAPVLSMRTSQ